MAARAPPARMNSVSAVRATLEMPFTAGMNWITRALAKTPPTTPRTVVSAGTVPALAVMGVEIPGTAIGPVVDDVAVPVVGTLPATVTLVGLVDTDVVLDRGTLPPDALSPEEQAPRAPRRNRLTTTDRRDRVLIPDRD